MYAKNYTIKIVFFFHCFLLSLCNNMTKCNVLFQGSVRSTHTTISWKTWYARRKYINIYVLSWRTRTGEKPNCWLIIEFYWFWTFIYFKLATFKIFNDIESHLINVQAWVKLLNPTYAMCKIHCYGGQNQLETLSKRNPIVKAAMRHHKPVIGK